ncbi:sporulation histidine kinase inhibitor Sda [Ammoniphilus sp. YIM 78166]|uniref:sporulation histidine kinase inhibitor Sda n=1 Tax=Ammoniphilus sp. YIM 78166 TaxID=1644106 RepID=UPI001F0FB666|nr:sporulation histidine kinase inhibitor Sda [Ammoniphilus sp. YIM 78166]
MTIRGGDESMFYWRMVLTDVQLIEIYKDAIRKKLDFVFIELLLQELKHRNITIIEETA